jgi:hypothetical protein
MKVLETVSLLSRMRLKRPKSWPVWQGFTSTVLQTNPISLGVTALLINFINSDWMAELLQDIGHITHNLR